MSKLVDGEASAEDVATLRPHVRTCLSCRATLREYRTAPATAAALVPAAILASPGRPPLLDVPARLAEAVAGWTQKAHAAVEMASAQKVAAVATSAAVLGGGAAVTVEQVERKPESPRKVGHVERGKPAPPPPAAAETSAPPPAPAPAPQPPSAAERRARLAREAERKTPPAQQEFEPAWAAGEPAPTGSTATASASSTTSEPAPAPAPQPTRSGDGAEEFAP